MNIKQLKIFGVCILALSIGLFSIFIGVERIEDGRMLFRPIGKIISGLILILGAFYFGYVHIKKEKTKKT